MEPALTGTGLPGNKKGTFRLKVLRSMNSLFIP